MLLPPTVVGPINELAKAITVLGAVEGARVQLLADGAPIGIPATAGGLSTSVPLGPSLLTPGQKIAATQTRGANTSEPSPFPETVAAAPSAASGLPALAFLSGLHACVDWILLGGAIPGATVQVLYNGQVAGEAVAEGPTVSVPIDFQQTPGAGDTLEALQVFKTASGVTIKSSPVPSLPIGGRIGGELPAPSVQPPFECDLAVLVNGLQEGVSLSIKHNSDELSGYPYVGSPVWAQLLKPARGSDQIRAQQRFRRCGASGLSPAVGVNPAVKLPTPVIVGPVCPNAPVLRVRNLRPGAEVTVSAAKVATTGSASVTVGQARAWATDCDFNLPPSWANHPQLTSAQGKLVITVIQANCDRGSDTAAQDVVPLPGSVGQPAIDNPVECARLIRATSLTPGAVVFVTSNQVDSPQLSGVVLVSAQAMPIGVYRPLRPGERIQVKQIGCSVAGDSPQTEVAPFAGVPAPVVAGPVRIPRGGVTLQRLIVGARVHVFVGSKLAASADAVAEEMFVFVSGLQREVIVSARQSMCTKISDESNLEPAKLGEMKPPSHSPASITRTVNTNITVTANDADTGQPVNGSVKINGTSVGVTGTPFSFTFPMGAAPASIVDAADYFVAPIAWVLKDPPPQPPKQLHLSIANQAPNFFSITSVAWSIERQELNGTFTLVASPTGQAVSVTPPTNGQYHIYAAVSVDDLVNGGNVLAEFRGNVVVHGLSTLLVVWTNTDLSHGFRLIAEPQVVWAGGGAYTVYNPVVLS